MSQRQSRQAKHIESIQKIFTDYDDKIQMRSPSPQPTSPYPSARFAIHRKTANNRRHNKNHNYISKSHVSSPQSLQTQTTPTMQNIPKALSHDTMNNKITPSLKKAKSLNSSDITAPATTIGSMFDSNKKSSIADLHRNNLLENNVDNTDDTDDYSLSHINIPHYNTQLLFNKFDLETAKLTDICNNYGSLQQSFSKIIREQSICITQLLNELDKKNNQIKYLKNALKQQHDKHQQSLLTTKSNTNQNHHHRIANQTNVYKNNNGNNIQPTQPVNGQYLTTKLNAINNNGINNNNNMNRKYQQHRNGQFNEDEYEQIMSYIPIHNI